MSATSSEGVDPRPRAMVVDDHQLLAQSLGLALGAAGVACHVPADVRPEAVLQDVADWDPDLVLLDLDLGEDTANGSDLVTPVVLRGARVIVVTATTDEQVLAHTLEAGASALIDKRLPFDQLLAAVLAAARGEELMSPTERLRIITAARRRRLEEQQHLAPFERLTEREAQVLRHLTDGNAVTSIARHRCVSEATVRSQVRAVLLKLGVSSQLEAVALARRAGWT